MRRLSSEDCEILVADRKTLDLTNQRAAEDWLAWKRPDAIFLAAELVVYMPSGVKKMNTSFNVRGEAII